MATIIDFYGPELKTERAEQHILELESIFSAFIRKNREAIFAKAKNKKWQRRDVAVGGPFPRHTPTVLGDAVHNLRAALDHAYCTLVEVNGQVPTRYTVFPFEKDRQSVAARIKGQVTSGAGPSGKVRDLILDTIQPYSGGQGEGLYAIHQIDITDKHLVLIPTVTKMSLHGFRGHFPNGNIVRMNDLSLTGFGKNFQKEPLITFTAGLTLKMEKDAKASFEIGFDKGSPLEGQGILDALRNLLVLTRSTLELLKLAA